jgi:hypothetical protein
MKLKDIVRVIIKFPEGLNYVGELLEKNGEIGVVSDIDNDDNKVAVYFHDANPYQYWFDEKDLEIVK